MKKLGRLYLAILIFISSAINIFAMDSMIGLNLQLKKNETTENQYDNGDGVRYDIILTNNSNKDFKGSIGFMIGSLLSPLDGGGVGKIFRDIQNSGDKKGENTSLGEYSLSGSLFARNVFIPIGGEVHYIVRGTINKNVNGPIKAVVNVRENNKVILTEKNIMTRAIYDLDVNNIGPKYYEKGGIVKYEISVKNMGNTPVKALSIKEDFDQSIFKSIKITGETSIGDNSVGDYSPNGNLNVKNILLQRNATVVYKIEGQLQDDYMGEINVKAYFSARNKTHEVPANSINLVRYTYKIETTSEKDRYAPNNIVIYKVKITNTSSDISINKMNIIDNILDIKTKDAKGNDIFAFDKKRSTITASVENNSSSGIFNPQGNLNARDVMIAPNESVVYIIKLFTNESIVGEIKNNAKVIDRNGDEKESNTVILTSEPYKLQLNKKAVSDVKYMPGEQISFDISVKNIGKGIYYNGIIIDKIDELKSMLANSSLGSSSEDVLESPVSQWNISAKLGGDSKKSESNLILNGGEENNKGLNDTNVIIYPQEEIEYSVNITTKKTAISKIENTAKVEDLKSTAFYEPQELAKLKDISIIKTTNQSEYEPGDNIIYKIVVRNNNGLKFANNINITDNLSNILATQIDGNKELAFENWKLEVVKTEGVGTASGDFPYGELQSSNKNLKITADIASGGEIEYKLIAKVKATTIGVIIDSSKDDDVAEKGTGVKMAPPKLGIIKEVNSTEYTPGSDLIYKITIDNTGKGIAVNIPVKDIFSNIKTDLVTGEKGEAYKGIEVTGVILNSDGTINTEKPDFIGFNGTLVNEDLNTNIILSPDKKIVYTVKAKINDLASGKIMNIASVNGELVSDKGAVTKIKNIILEKNVDKQLYPNNVGKNGLITGPEKITYTIKISNRADSGFAMNIPVIDKISQITGETLSGNIVNVFTNGWNITTNCVGVGTRVSGNKIENNKDINTKVNIAPDGYVEIKVSGDVYRDGENILYGSFSNSVESGTLSKKVTTNPKKPFLKVFKGTKEPVYTDGGYITYSIIVENVGEGYANNAKIEDNILNIKDKNGKKVFASWEITSSTTGNGTKALPIKNNENIDSTMDIAPNGGKIIYTVKGKLNVGLEGSITNEVVVTDMQTSNKITASATQDKASNTGTLYIRKTTETSSINPLDKFTYIISVVNNSEKKLEGITVKDDLNKIIGNLANENGKNIEDVKGKVFSSWDIYKGNIKINTQANEILNDNIDHLDKHGVINYKIIAIPNKKVLQQKIKNTAYIYKNDKVIEKSSVENIVLGSNGGTTRSVNLSKYKPGDTLIYKIKISPQDVGYLNNYHINENINDLNVNLMNGTKGNVFFNPLTNRNEYSVSFIENESKVSSGTVVIPESHIKNNENLQGVVDVAQGDYLVYEIKGKIRPDIIGDINYKGVITTGYRHNLTVTKKVENRSYIPGKSLTYVLRVENNSNGNAGQISLIDDLEKVMVENSEGVNEGAFKKDTTKIINITKGGYGASAPVPKNLNSIKTLIDVPVGGFIQYKISTVVNDKAVGNIVNLLNVDGDTVSSGIRLPQGKIKIEKTMGNYYDTDGVTVVKEGYVPGGYVDYTIRLTNISDSILDDYTVKDSLGDITSELANGKDGKVFTNWKVDVEKDSSLATNPGDISNNININTKVDIGPRGYIQYKIHAKISSFAVGNFTNSVDVNGIVRSSKMAKMALPVIVHSKKVYNSEGDSEITTFYPGESITYKILLKNTGKGTSYGYNFKDILSSIQTDIAGVGKVKGNPFESWEVITSKQGDITSIGTYIPKKNSDIDSSNVIISQNGSILFIIKAKLKDNIFGKITNKSIYGPYNDSVEINSLPGKIKLSNKITKLDNKSFSIGDKYKPGDSIEYTVVLENSGKGFLGNTDVLDYVSGITTELAWKNPTTEFALDNISYTMDYSSDSRTVVSNGENDSKTYIRKVVDLAPKSKIVFVIKGDIKKTALGKISANVFYANGETANSETVESVPSKIVGSKVLIEPTNKIYKPGDTVKYIVTVENLGEGYGNDIPIKDLLSNVETEIVGSKNGQAFSNWTITDNITYKNPTFNSLTYLNNKVNGVKGIDLLGDIAPESKIEFTINAEVSSNAVGKIINNAQINNENYSTEAITLKPALKNEIKAYKIVSNTEYSPDKELGFKIIIKNNSDTTINDLKLTDMIGNIETEISGGGNGKAFKGGWRISTNIIGDSQNSANNIPKSGNIENSYIDLAKGAELTINIMGQASSNALGKIINNALWNYNGMLNNEIQATVKPNLGEMEIEKTVNKLKYEPDKELEYTIKVKNIGKGFINNGEIIDNLTGINTTVIDDKTEKAFKDFRVISETSGNSNTKFGNINSLNGYEQKEADIYPGDTVIIKLGAIVNKKAVGSIENIAQGKYLNSIKKSSINLETEEGVLSAEKTVDILNYNDGDTLTYSINVKNTGKGWLKKVRVLDRLQGVTTDFISGTGSGYIGDAFENVKNIDEVLNVAPGQTETVVAKCKIKKHAIGEIENIAIVNGINTNKVISMPKIADLSLDVQSEKFYKISNGNNPLEKNTIKYNITVTNIGKSIANIELDDNIKDILVKSNLKKDMVAFKNWKVISLSNNKIHMNVKLNEETTKNLKLNGILEVGENVNLVLECTINELEKEAPISNIINNIILKQGPLSNNKEVVTKPTPAIPSLENKILMLDGKIYTNQTYKPKDTVTYEILFENKGDGFLNEFNLIDNVSTMIGKLAGSQNGESIENWKWKVESSSLKTVYNIDDFKENSDLNAPITLAPNSVFKVILTGNINKLSVGVIPPNKAYLGVLKSFTKEIKPSPSEYTLEKRIIDGNPYSQSGILNYEIKIQNTGKSFISGLKLKDELDKIVTNGIGGNSNLAFEQPIIYLEKEPNEGLVFLKNSYPTTGNLDENIDIGPNTTVKFKISAKVKGNIYGDIVNRVVSTLDGVKKEATATAISKKGVIKILNTPISNEYIPGGDLGFNIIVENTGEGIANDVNIKDIINSMRVETIKGKEEFPFKSYCISSETVGDLPNTTIKINKNDNIDVIGDIASKTKINISIKGIAIDNAIGDVVNTVSAKYNGKIQSKEGIVHPSKGKLIILKTSNLEKYIPGQSIDYKIRINNTGIGYMKNIEIEDDLNMSKAFDVKSAKIISEKIDSPLSSISKGTIENGVYKVKTSIHPKGYVEIILRVNILKNIMNPIENIVNGIYDGVTYKSSCILESEPGLLSIEKNQDSNVYIPQVEKEYTLKIFNKGNGWLKNVNIYDNVKDLNSLALGGIYSKVFDEKTIKTEIVSQGESNLKILDDKNVHLQGDIAPNSEAIIKISGVLTDNIVGTIENTARGTINKTAVTSNKVIATQELPPLKLIKSANVLNYEVGKEVVYTLKVVNGTLNNAVGVHLTDELSKIMVVNSKGNKVRAFKDGWKISYTAKDDATTVKLKDGSVFKKGDIISNQDLDAIIDLHSLDTVIFTIKAVVIDDAMESIENVAHLNESGIEYKSSNKIFPYKKNITILKRSNSKKYSPGKDFTYTVNVTNIGKGYGANIPIEDEIDKIKVETTKGLQNAFVMSTVKIKIFEISLGVKSEIKDELIGKNLKDNIQMPPQGSITYEITGEVNPLAIGEIQNIALADNKKSMPVITESEGYNIDVELSQEKEYYTLNSKDKYNAIYTMTIKNNGSGIAHNIDVEQFIKESLSEEIDGDKKIQAFESWDILSSKKTSDDIFGNIKNNESIKTKVTLTPNSWISYTVKGVVNKKLTGDIIISSKVQGYAKDLKVIFKPQAPKLTVTKTSDKKEYLDKDDKIKYLIKVENIGPGNAKNVSIKDMITDLKGKNGNSLFTSWIIEDLSKKDRPLIENQNLDEKINLVPNEKYQYNIVGNINKGLDDNITNEVIVINPVTGEKSIASVTNHVKKIPDNEGELKVIKKAYKKNIKVGEPVEYEVIIENNNESKFFNTALKDEIPPGFKYVKNTSEIVYSGLDRKFDTSDDKIIKGEPIVGKELIFPKFILQPFEKYRVRYILKASVGVTFGNYINTAYVELKNKVISNKAQATVTITPDSLLDTTTIIGKVFNDINGDGYQNTPVAKDVTVILNPKSDIEKKIDIGTLIGVSRNRNIKGTDKKVINLKGYNNKISKIKITSAEGLNILLNENGQVIDNSKGSVLSKINTQNLKVTLKDNKLQIENKGLYEEGIAGVRLITPKGDIVESDGYGRYHLPDQWIYNKNGENYSIKLDEKTLPKNMIVISENPMVKKISSYSLNKFNFSVINRELTTKENERYSSRMYLKKGAIWVINDDFRVKPKLILEVPKNVEIKNGKIKTPINMSIETNYGDFITKYELNIYKSDDFNLLNPIGTIIGEKIYNNMDIKWTGGDNTFTSGEEIKYVLKVFDKNGNFDKTKIAISSIVKKEPKLEINEKDYNEVSQEIRNIQINTGAVRFVGAGLRDVDKIYIDKEEYSIDSNNFVLGKYMSSGNHNIPIKVVYENKKEEQQTLNINLPETYYLQTGIADISMGRNYVSGNTQVLDVENPFGPEYYNGNIYNEGRLAYYSRGKYKNKLRLTTYFDTKTDNINNLFNNMLKRDKRNIFERLDNNKNAYYPIYGDDSYGYKGIDTDGKIFLNLEYNKSNVLWGNYNTGFTDTEFMQYNRSLYGLDGNYKSKEVTKFGDNKIKVQGFTSQPDTLYAHDEFLGTGGSLYFLRNSDILRNTEKVMVKIVNKKTMLTEKIVYLQEGKDYSFDAFQGRIILNKPLNGTYFNDNSDIIQDSTSGNSYIFLVVDYEYIPNKNIDVSNNNYGFNGTVWVNNHIGVGGRYIKESKENKNYYLKGGILTLKGTENSYIKGEISETYGSQGNNNFVSFDGGLNFRKISRDLSSKTGKAYNYMGVLNLYDINPKAFTQYGNEIKVWYKNKDSNYSFASYLENKGLINKGIEVDLKNTDKIKTKLKYEKTVESEVENKNLSKLESLEAQLKYIFRENILMGVAFKQEKEEKDSEIGTGKIVGGKLEYKIDDNTKIYTEAQGTISRSKNYEKNNILTLGGEKDITEKLSVNGKTSIGSRGNYNEVGTSYDMTDNYNVYFSYTQDKGKNENKLTGGQRLKLNDKFDIYQENQFVTENGKRGILESYGLDYNLSKDIDLGMSLQRGRIKLPDNGGNSKRKGVSFYSNVDKDKLSLRNKIEYREESGNEGIKQFLTTNDFQYKLTEEYTLGGKFNYIFTDEEKYKNSEDVESSLGFAYRPIYDERLNLLWRYTVLLNNNPKENKNLKAYVVESEGIYSITQRLDLGLKGAYRKEENTFERESKDSIQIKNNIYLMGVKANYKVINNWDLTLQYHWLVDEREKDISSGAIVGLYKNLNRNFKFGGGYNFSQFNDNLNTADYKSHGWFINIIGRI